MHSVLLLQLYRKYKQIFLPHFTFKLCTLNNSLAANTVEVQIALKAIKLNNNHFLLIK